jgi:hypothetical protein
VFLVLVIVLILLAFGGMPAWGYHPYGWYPSGVVVVLVVILVLFMFSGRL